MPILQVVDALIDDFLFIKQIYPPVCVTPYVRK
jgi:hypothetical protein